MHHNIFFSLFDNHISVSMGKADMQLPSKITDIGYREHIETYLPLGKLKCGIDMQYKKKGMIQNENHPRLIIYSV